MKPMTLFEKCLITQIIDGDNNVVKQLDEDAINAWKKKVHIIQGDILTDYLCNHFGDSIIKRNKKYLKRYETTFTEKSTFEPDGRQLSILICKCIIKFKKVKYNPDKENKIVLSNETTASLYEDQRKLKTPLVGTVIRVELT